MKQVLTVHGLFRRFILKIKKFGDDNGMCERFERFRKEIRTEIGKTLTVKNRKSNIKEKEN